MKSILFIVFISLLPFSGYSQGVSIDSLKKHVGILASDEMNGRKTGTEGGKMAADYIAGQMEQLGLEPGANNSFFNEFSWSYKSKNPYEFEIAGTIYRDSRDDYLGQRYYLSRESKRKYYVQSWDNVKTQEKVDKSTLTYRFVKRIYNDKTLVNTILAMADEAKDKFCRTLLLIHEDQAQLERVERLLKEDKFSSFKRNLGVVHSIEGGFSESIKSTEFVHISNKYILTGGTNVIGQLNSDKDGGCILIGGHFDHEGRKKGLIYNGADDNASGIALILALIEEVKKLNIQKRIVFVAFDAEELGLVGSKNLVKKNILGEVDLMINLDMVGRMGEKNPKINFLASQKLFNVVSPYFEKSQIDYRLGKNTGDYYYRSDHYPFAEENIPYISILGLTHEDYHMPSDEIDYINWEPMTLLAKDLLFILSRIRN